jgi:hypothetical protein
MKTKLATNISVGSEDFGNKGEWREFYKNNKYLGTVV